LENTNQTTVSLLDSAHSNEGTYDDESTRATEDTQNNIPGGSVVQEYL